MITLTSARIAEFLEICEAIDRNPHAFFDAARTALPEALRDLTSAQEALAKVTAERDALREVVARARDLIREGHSTGRDSRHGWEMNGERAYLVDACAFDELSNAAVALTNGHAS